MGSSVCHVAVRRPPATVSLISSPFEAAVRCSGTVMLIVNVALSVGWLLDGNHDIEPDGSLAV